MVASSITEAGNDPKVAGLVYVAAFAPDANQTITEISKPFPPPLGSTKLKPLSDGFLLLSADGVETAFAQDLGSDEKALLVALQPQNVGVHFRGETHRGGVAQQTIVVHRRKQRQHDCSQNKKGVWPADQCYDHDSSVEPRRDVCRTPKK